MAAGGDSLACAHHPHRAGVALCVTCRRTVCGECTTRFSGINYCSTCVAELGQPGAAAEAHPRRSRVIAGLVLAVGYLGVAVALYALGAIAAP